MEVQSPEASDRTRSWSDVAASAELAQTHTRNPVSALRPAWSFGHHWLGA
jgi:hypothetical protein